MTLAACSSEKNQAKGIQSAAKAKLQEAIAKRQGKAVAPKPLTYADIAEIQTPLAQVSVPSVGYKEVAKLVSTNNGYSNFYTGSNKSFVMRGGQLTATRGLRFDLMSRDLQSESRTYRFLSSTNGIEQIVVNCEVVSKDTESVTILDRQFNLKLTEEVCRNEFRAFKNRTWTDRNGKIRKAQQWISQRQGFAVIEWLN
jgi:hypothetical protein